MSIAVSAATADGSADSPVNAYPPAGDDDTFGMTAMNAGTEPLVGTAPAEVPVEPPAAVTPSIVPVATPEPDADVMPTLAPVATPEPDADVMPTLAPVATPEPVADVMPTLAPVATPEPDADVIPEPQPVTAPPIVASPPEPVVEAATTTDTPVADFTAPSLPSVAETVAAASPVAPPNHQPDQSHAVGSAAAWLEANSPGTPIATSRPVKSGRSGRAILMTLTAAVLAVGVGAGAHLGYDWYQTRNDVSPAADPAVAGSELAAWSNVDPPALRYTDTSTTINGVDGTRQLTTHRDLVSGARIITVVDTDAAGLSTTYDVDLRADQAFLREAPEAPWTEIPIEQARSIVGDETVSDVFTISDVFPTEAIPHADVLENVERQLTLGIIQERAIAPEAELAEPGAEDADAADAPPAPAQLAPGTVAPTQVWHYRVILDTEAFRAADGAAYEAWERHLGRLASPRLEIWVDGAGVVRQFVIEEDGSSTTQTLLGGSPVSTRFDAPPVVVDAADDPATIAPEAGQ